MSASATATPTAPHRLTTAQQDLAALNLRLVGYCLSIMLRRFPDLPGDVVDELRAEGELALVRAARAFDPGRGVASSTFACIAILNWFGNYMLRRRRRRQHEEPSDGILDTIADHREREPDDELSPDLADALSTLRPRWQHLVRLRFGLSGDGDELSTEELATRLGVSRTRVNQMLAKALGRLRAVLA